MKRRPHPSDYGPLFANDREAQDRLVERLKPLAIELAAAARGRGIIVADVRARAVERGILTGEEKGRWLSFLWRVPKVAGLVEKDEWRRSAIDQSHGNLQRVWVAREFANEVAA